MSDFAKPFRRPDFRRLFAGATTSQLGDQFALVATPWLVMHLTGDPLALGLVLALEGAPRALFMLLGGAVTVLGARGGGDPDYPRSRRGGADL